MLTYIDETAKTRSTVEEFLGIRKRSRISEKEAHDSYNLTNDDYPVLSSRKKYSLAAELGDEDEVLAILGGEKLAMLKRVEGSALYFEYGDEIYEHIGTVQDGVRYQLVRIGAYIVCYPTTYVYNTATGRGEHFYIDAEARDGVVLTNVVSVGAGASGIMKPVQKYYDATNVTDGEYTLKVADDGTYAVYCGNEPTSFDTYIKIEGLGHNADAETFDVMLTGFGEAGETVERGFAWRRGTGSSRITDGAVYISGLTNQLRAEIREGGKSLEITNPAMGVVGDFSIKYKTNYCDRFDHIIECKNRLWACRSDGTVNEIYATELGSYSRWVPSDVPSESAYTVSVGSYGRFTGACTYGDNPIFFKEEFAHKVYVSSSGAHQLHTSTCRGVEEGSHQSIAEIGGYLYYKARGGFVRFDGSSAIEISEEISGGDYRLAIAGREGEKYVAACESASGEQFVFVYDTRYRTWQRESSELIRSDNRLTALEEQDGRLIFVINHFAYYHDHRDGDVYVPGVTEDHVRYMYESGDVGFSDMEKKYICRLDMRVLLGFGARFNVWIQYDSDGRWQEVRRAVGERPTPRVDTLRIMPRRCDHFRIRITGRGDMKLYGITKVYEEGEII